MSATILEYWRRVTFDFASPKGSTSGVFDVKVDSKGVPIVEKNSCIWKNVSGDSLTSCQYSPDNMAIQTANGGGAITDFSVALENTTYTIAVGTWSYVNANVEGFTITTSTGTGSKIMPEGNVTVLSGEDQSFIIEATDGYELSSVLVDGVESISQLVKGIYTFSNVQADHTLSASGTALPTYNITSTAGVGGTISPSGTTSVYEGYSQEYSITPSEGCGTSSVLIDGVESISQLIDNEYTFTNVNADHTISASFTGEVITKTYRVITFSFEGKGTYSGVFQIAVDSNGIPDTTDFENISGDGVEDVNYGINDVLNFNSIAGAGYLSNFSTAQPNQTYTEKGDLNGTWSYTLGSTVTTYTIIPSASTGGSISPNTPQIVDAGSDQTFTITPAEGYEITSVLVDGVDAGKVTTYTFTNVNDVHTISASFEVIAPSGFNLDKMVDTDYLMQGIMKK